MSTTELSESDQQSDQKQVRNSTRLFRGILVTAGAVTVLAGSYMAYAYASSPINIREPLFEHYHTRMSLVVGGKEVNFADPAFQVGYSKDNCNAMLTTQPFHFHDNKNHFVHVHWEGMTGGQLLKYYGWNFIGGSPGSLGYRTDQGLLPVRVPIHGEVLPAKPESAKYYVFTGNAQSYSERSMLDFTSQDLEKFFGKVSNSPAHELNKQKRKGLAAWLFPKASAHGTEVHTEDGHGDAHNELTELNNLIGDVVLFVQKEKPSDSQIKQRFDSLTALGESTCGG